MLLITTTGRQRQREYEAWADGYHLGEEETDEALADKDAFIAQQAELIQELIKRDLIQWDQLTKELWTQLADYV